MGIILILLIFYPIEALLEFKYLNKGMVLRAEIFGVFIPHLRLYIGEISLKLVTSIEHGWSSLSLSSNDS
jgi:hypothetical protein